jgi:hypothetical protein
VMTDKVSSCLGSFSFQIKFLQLYIFLDAGSSGWRQAAS